jgi:hypothetical protein
MHCVRDDLGGRPRQCLLGLSLCWAENALQTVHVILLGLLVTQDREMRQVRYYRRMEYGGLKYAMLGLRC